MKKLALLALGLGALSCTNVNEIKILYKKFKNERRIK